MQLPGFSAEASLERARGTYRFLGAFGRGAAERIFPQFTPRPGSSMGIPLRLPDNLDHYMDPGAQPSYCDTRCLRECQEAVRRICGGDGLCTVEAMPTCRQKCCFRG